MLKAVKQWCWEGVQHEILSVRHHLTFHPLMASRGHHYRNIPPGIITSNALACWPWPSSYHFCPSFSPPALHSQLELPLFSRNSELVGSLGSSCSLKQVGPHDHISRAWIRTKSAPRHQSKWLGFSKETWHACTDARRHLSKNPCACQSGGTFATGSLLAHAVPVTSHSQMEF